MSRSREDIIPLGNDTHVDEETIIDGIIDLESLHHALGFNDISPCSNLREDVVYEGNDYSLENFSLPPFLLKEEDTINDTPQEIIIESLHHETMVMSVYQPMTPVLCQLLPYPSLKENDEHKERAIYSTTKGVSHSLIEDVVDDASSCEEDID